MAIVYTNPDFFDGQNLEALFLNQYFADISNKFNTDGIVDADISDNANISASKVDLAFALGRITQTDGLDADATPSVSLNNAGSAGIIEIDNGGTGPDILAFGPSFIIDLDNNDDDTNESLTISKNNGAATIIAWASDGLMTFGPVDKYLHIGPAQFVGPMTELMRVSSMEISTDGQRLSESGNATKFFVASIALPDNIVIKELSAVFRKQRSSASSTVEIQAFTVANATISTLASVDTGSLASSASFASVSTATISSATVSNNLNRYQISASLNNVSASTDIQLSSVRIKYEVREI